MLLNKKCLQCWAEFKTYAYAQIYCSQKCSWLARRLWYKKCHYCWKVFKPKTITTIYCSNSCRHNGHKLTDEEKTITCPVCGQKFIRKHTAQKYCSIKCWAKWGWLSGKKKEIADNKKANCLYCGRDFIKRHKTQKYCCLKCSHRSLLHWQSKENKCFWKLLMQLGFEWEDEFYLWWYFYDFKIWNILIELNPFTFHNSTFVPPKCLAKPKHKMYHYNKYQNAVKRWYRCIMVWDWTGNLTDMITDGQFHYEWLPQLHYYNPKTKEHIIRRNRNKSRIDKWFVEIRDCGKETF